VAAVSIVYFIIHIFCPDSS